MARPAYRSVRSALGRARSLAAGGLAAFGLAACAVDPSSIPGGFVLGPNISGQHVVGAPANPIQRALAFCDEKTETAETACVRQALVDGHLEPAALAAMLPGCKLGASCKMTYRTRDRLGLLAVTTTQYVADWLVTFDLRNPQAGAADLPLTVQQI